MKSSSARRLSAAVIAPVLALGVIAGTTQSAQAAGPNSYAYSSASWLSDQLTNGLIHNPNFGGFDDYGLSIDTFLALHTLGTRASTATSIIDAIKVDPTQYTTDPFTPDSAFAGATAKLATAVQLEGDEPTSFGGHNLISELGALVVTTGDETGRAKDSYDFGSGPEDFSNSIGQSFVVRALATATDPLAASTTTFLLKQQCADGSVRVVMSSTQCTTGEGTVDGTALAIQALEVAKTAGQTGLQDEIDSATAWLVGAQAADGSYSDGTIANTNSTGLAAATLKQEGKVGPAGNAAAWIVGHEVTDSVADDTALSNELGAIAFDQDALAAGKTDGITDETRDQWIRATAQAAIGINALLPAKALTVTAPSGLKSGGKKVTISVAGLAPFEKFTIALAGSTAVNGTASATGTGSAAIATATSTADRIATVTGSRATRVGTTTIKVLGAKTLPVKVKYATKAANHTQTVTVSGLANGEPVRVYLSNTKIKTDVATAAGTFSYSFDVGSSKGTKTVKVLGAFSNRVGTKTFKVT